MMDVFSIYERLWQQAETLGARVQYDGFMADGSGGFHPHPAECGEPSPAIMIGRPYYEEFDRPTRFRNAGGRDKLPPPDLLQETMTLAHEIGHFMSWKERTPRGTWDKYFLAAKLRDDVWNRVPREGTATEYNTRSRTAAREALPPDDIQRILAEEEFAWAIGREFLELLGFSHFNEYSERCRRGLHFHRYRLGLDELWSDDIEAENEPPPQVTKS